MLRCVRFKLGSRQQRSSALEDALEPSSGWEAQEAPIIMWLEVRRPDGCLWEDPYLGLAESCSSQCYMCGFGRQISADCHIN
jgi:hypothetical protein